MNAPRRGGGWVIVVSLVGALVLAVVPLPESVDLLRPPWPLLVIIYWVLALPERVGVGVAWCSGLLVDVLRSTLLGAHGFAFALVAWLTMKLHQRLRVFPLWQQAFTVLLLTLLVRVLLFWLDGITGQPEVGWQHWLPAPTAAVVWPLVFVFLREMRRRFNVR